MSEDLARRLEALSPLLDAVCRALQEQVHRLGFPPGEIRLLGPGQASFRLERDPASGEHSLVGEWRDPRRGRIGSLVFHADGSFFAEQDLVRAHPARPGWLVEAVTAWGRGADIRAEPRLLPSLS